ncbi:hypothetical protein EV656_102357 [Rhodovulum adriaticum]|uniref:Uncharacterized protein n=1 Tax=Rhodovulum adriaticum TaxID=35804 RepID=A0A4R2NXZ1_RHOAD|nr:hypothetical protein EV656_102357 [Rhodovulum adriaticum]
MKKNNRWMAWIIAESAKPMHALPWERSARHMPAATREAV